MAKRDEYSTIEQNEYSMIERNEYFCSFGDCLNAPYMTGLCSGHYNQRKIRGFLSELDGTRLLICSADRCSAKSKRRYCPEHAADGFGTCAVTDCDRALASARGNLCSSHARINSHHKFKFGMTLLERLEREALTEGACGICGGVFEKLDLDHNHQTNAIRGFLCGSCNRAIGLMQDDPERLRAAADYLEKM